MHIYIIKCEGKYFFIGETEKDVKEIENHMEDYGGAWTELHKPKRVSKFLEDQVEYSLDRWVIRGMAEFGKDNVRGGNYSTVELDEEQNDTIDRLLESEECYLCQENHPVKDCPVEFFVKREKKDVGTQLTKFVNNLLSGIVNLASGKKINEVKS